LPVDYSYGMFDGFFFLHVSRVVNTKGACCAWLSDHAWIWYNWLFVCCNDYRIDKNRVVIETFLSWVY